MRLMIVGGLLSLGTLSLGLMSTACAHELDIVNRSKTTVHHLYLSDSKDAEWGPDQFGNGNKDVVEPGETFTLTDIEPGRYDVKVVAADGTECVIENVRIAESKEWVITESMLDDCEG